MPNLAATTVCPFRYFTQNKSILLLETAQYKFQCSQSLIYRLIENLLWKKDELQSVDLPIHSGFVQCQHGFRMS